MAEVSFKQTRHVAASELLVTAAEKVMIRKGFESVTMREVAAEAGCCPATLYQYFENKHDLLTEIVARHSQRILDLMEKAAKDAPDPVACLRATMQCRIEYVGRHKYSARLFFTSVPRSTADPLHFLPKRLHARWTGMRDHEIAAIRKAQHLGALRRDIDAETIHVFMHRVISSLLEHWITGEGMGGGDPLKIIWELLAKGMGIRNGQK